MFIHMTLHGLGGWGGLGGLVGWVGGLDESKKCSPTTAFFFYSSLSSGRDVSALTPTSVWLCCWKFSRSSMSGTLCYLFRISCIVRRSRASE